MDSAASGGRPFPGWVGLLIVITLWTALVIFPGDRRATTRVTGEGMRPQLSPGDLLVMRLPGAIPGRGDIVVFSASAEQLAEQPLARAGDGLYVSRAVGLPGDQLEIAGNAFILNDSERIEAPPGRHWDRHRGSSRIPEGKFFLLTSGDPAQWTKGGESSQFMGLIDLAQMRVAREHMPRDELLRSAPLIPLCGGGLVVLLGWVFWFCGQYCRPLLPLKIILGMSWFGVVLIFAILITSYFGGREDHSPMVFLASIYFWFFSRLETGQLLNAGIVGCLLALAFLVSRWAHQRAPQAINDEIAAAADDILLLRVWPLAFGIAAICLAVFNSGAVSGRDTWSLITVLAGIAILFSAWQCEAAAIKSDAGRGLVWLGRAIRGLRLVIGLIGIASLASLLWGAITTRRELIDLITSTPFLMDALWTALFMLYGLPGIRRLKKGAIVRMTFAGPVSPVRLAGLLTILAGVTFLAYQRLQPYSQEAAALQAVGATIAFARAASEDFVQTEGRLPDELDTVSVFGDSPIMRGAAFIGPGVLRISVPIGRDQPIQLFMLFEHDPGKPFTIGIRCIHDAPDVADSAMRGCVRQKGFDVRRYGSRRSLIARTARAADGPFAQTQIFFRLHGSGRADMGPASLPPPARNNPEAARYAQMLDASVKETVFPGGEMPREIEVVGFADATGPETTNQLLSEQRAETVRGYLVELGVPVSAISIRGAGPEAISPECSPTQTSFAQCLYRSRRVDVRVWQ